MNLGQLSRHSASITCKQIGWTMCVAACGTVEGVYNSLAANWAQKELMLLQLLFFFSTFHALSPVW